MASKKNLMYLAAFVAGIYFGAKVPNIAGKLPGV